MRNFKVNSIKIFSLILVFSLLLSSVSFAYNIERSMLRVPMGVRAKSRDIKEEYGSVSQKQQLDRSIKVALPDPQIIIDLLDINKTDRSTVIIKGWEFGTLKRVIAENGMLNAWNRSKPEKSPRLAACSAIAIWLVKNKDRAGRVRQEEEEWLNTVVKTIEANFVPFLSWDIGSGLSESRQPYSSTHLSILSVIGIPAAVLTIAAHGNSFIGIPGGIYSPFRHSLIWYEALKEARINALPLILHSLGQEGASLMVNGDNIILTEELSRKFVALTMTGELSVAWHVDVHSEYEDTDVLHRLIENPKEALIIDRITTQSRNILTVERGRSREAL